jgi:aspartate kinase
MRVLKFGGTSVGTPEALRRAASIVRTELPNGGLVVVSALSGTTDTILEAVAGAARGDADGARQQHSILWQRHLTVARELGLLEAVQSVWEPLFERLGGILEGMGLLREASPRARDGVLAIGETLSAHLLASLLAGEGFPAAFREAREVVHTDARHGRAQPDPSAIRVACEGWRSAIQDGAVLVTQGFLGVAPDGATTTLGRGGSDTSATLLGEALGAVEVQIWTDVDGVLSADPSLVTGARPIPAMSLREAAALSAFGAKVLHADSLAPVARAHFRLVVANTHRPTASRTEILAQAPQRRPGEITSDAYKEGLACLRLAPTQDLEPLFHAALRLQEAGAARYGLLSTPDGSLLVVRPETPACEELLEELAEAGLDIQRGWAVVALVGEGLREAPGRALGLLSSLQEEPIAGILAGDTGVSLAFLVPEARLSSLIPRLHEHCFGA